MRNILFILCISSWSCAFTMLLLSSLPCTTATISSTDAELHPDNRVRGSSTHDDEQYQQQRRAQEGMPLPQSSVDSTEETTTVEYSPTYNTRMKACPGYEEEGLRGYVYLDDLRHDLQLYFYDMNGYSYHRTEADIAADVAADLLKNSPTDQPSASPSLSFPPTVVKSDVPSPSPSVQPTTLEPTDEPTSSVRLPREPTKSPSPTILAEFTGDTDGSLFGTDVIPDSAEDGTTFAPTGPIPSLRTASPTMRPTFALDENTLMRDGRNRLRGHIDDENGSGRRRLQYAMTTSTLPAEEYYVEVMSEAGLPEVDELVTGADGGESLIPVESSIAGSTTERVGMHFHICPDTNFQFNSIFVAQLKFLPLVLESPVQTPITLACLKEQTCTFNGGDYHIVVNNNGLEEDSLGESSIDQLHSTITLRGIVFQQAEEASIVMNDPRGKIVIDKCKWENNEGEAIVVDGKHNGNNKEREYYGVNDFMLPEGKENPFASTDPTVPVATTTFDPDLFGTTKSAEVTTTEVTTTEMSERGRLLEETTSAVVPKSLILIRKSTFTGNNGEATIVVDSSPEDEWKGSGSVHLELEKSTFSDERVRTSVIVTSGAVVKSKGNVFQKNRAKAMFETNSGTISITDTSFSNNVVTGRSGVVVVDIDSKVGDTNCVPKTAESEDYDMIALTSNGSRQRELDTTSSSVLCSKDGTCKTLGQVCDPYATPTFLAVREYVGESDSVVEESSVEGYSSYISSATYNLPTGEVSHDLTGESITTTSPENKSKSSKSGKGAKQQTLMLQQVQGSNLQDQDETRSGKSKKSNKKAERTRRKRKREHSR